MNRKFNFAPGEFYHIYSRGVDKRIVFTCLDDYERFVTLLYLANGERSFEYRNIKPEDRLVFERGETLVEIGTYCLMPNHFHLLLHEKKAGGIAIFMMRLLTAYAMYFNKKYQRTGALFESSFKATHADRDEYLKYLFAYIHLNPIKLIDSQWKENGIADQEKAEGYLRHYRWSSYRDYLSGDRPESVILNKEAFPDYFSSEKSFATYLNDWLNYLDEDTEG